MPPTRRRWVKFTRIRTRFLFSARPPQLDIAIPRSTRLRFAIIRLVKVNIVILRLTRLGFAILSLAKVKFAILRYHRLGTSDSRILRSVQVNIAIFRSRHLELCTIKS